MIGVSSLIILHPATEDARTVSKFVWMKCSSESECIAIQCMLFSLLAKKGECHVKQPDLK